MRALLVLIASLCFGISYCSIQTQSSGDSEVINSFDERSQLRPVAPASSYDGSSGNSQLTEQTKEMPYLQLAAVNFVELLSNIWSLYYFLSDNDMVVLTMMTIVASLGFNMYVVCNGAFSERYYPSTPSSIRHSFLAWTIFSILSSFVLFVFASLDNMSLWSIILSVAQTFGSIAVFALALVLHFDTGCLLDGSTWQRALSLRYSSDESSSGECTFEDKESLSGENNSEEPESNLHPL